MTGTSRGTRGTSGKRNNSVDYFAGIDTPNSSLRNSLTVSTYPTGLVLLRWSDSQVERSDQLRPTGPSHRHSPLPSGQGRSNRRWGGGVGSGAEVGRRRTEWCHHLAGSTSGEKVGPATSRSSPPTPGSSPGLPPPPLRKPTLTPRCPRGDTDPQRGHRGTEDGWTPPFDQCSSTKDLLLSPKVSTLPGISRTYVGEQVYSCRLYPRTDPTPPRDQRLSQDTQPGQRMRN